MSKWFFLFFASLLAFTSLEAQEPDSIRQREIRSGVYAIGESISDKFLSGNDGFGVEVGAYQERKLLDQVYLSYGAGIGFRDYMDTGIVVDTTPDFGDTAIISYFHDVSRNEIKLNTHAHIRFVYIENPNIFLTVGLGPELHFRQQLSNTYSFTRFTRFENDEFTTIGEATDRPYPVEEDEFRLIAFNLRFDVGLGIELNRFSIELINRSFNVQGFGVRLRYTFDTLTY